MLLRWSVSVLIRKKIWNLLLVCIISQTAWWLSHRRFFWTSSNTMFEQLGILVRMHIPSMWNQNVWILSCGVVLQALIVTWIRCEGVHLRRYLYYKFLYTCFELHNIRLCWQNNVPESMTFSDADSNMDQGESECVHLRRTVGWVPPSAVISHCLGGAHQRVGCKSLYWELHFIEKKTLIKLQGCKFSVHRQCILCTYNVFISYSGLA